MYLCVKCDRQYKSKQSMKNCPHKDAEVSENSSGENTLNEDDLKFNDLIVKIDELLAEDVKFIANHLHIDYVNKDDAVSDIKEFLGLN
ncbi:MAG: hypothetical protein GQ570_11790 [Helicobacteraceae bacterium]|nr:hypothetical protein [Helicobacteraceae bacterium]